MRSQSHSTLGEEKLDLMNQSQTLRRVIERDSSCKKWGHSREVAESRTGPGTVFEQRLPPKPLLPATAVRSISELDRQPFEGHYSNLRKPRPLPIPWEDGQKNV
ncbi:hypothetical protein GWK47_053121 [Chionoecetes opilio]|uniref:Uncharacterized protein n=1 Tax=Chionoecetes opilio TaxID=41210 RepID=A0A8J4Y5U4_CHIOP|nr:hypothetical protein GWK47_053121 [Chionoecetes opilio]